jgi:hypothetical protein
MPRRNAPVERVMNGPFPVGENGGHAVSRATRVLVEAVRAEGIMALSDVLAKIVGFLRAGYPEGVPVGDYIPLVALLRRRLSDDEVIAVATELISTGGAPVQGTDVRVAITKLTDELPSPEDTEPVKRRLAAAGWPVSDPFGSPAYHPAWSQCWRPATGGERKRAGASDDPVLRACPGSTVRRHPAPGSSPDE